MCPRTRPRAFDRCLPERRRYCDRLCTISNESGARPCSWCWWAAATTSTSRFAAIQNLPLRRHLPHPKAQTPSLTPRPLRPLTLRPLTLKPQTRKAQTSPVPNPSRRRVGSRARLAETMAAASTKAFACRPQRDFPTARVRWSAPDFVTMFRALRPPFASTTPPTPPTVSASLNAIAGSFPAVVVGRATIAASNRGTVRPQCVTSAGQRACPSTTLSPPIPSPPAPSTTASAPKTTCRLPTQVLSNPLASVAVCQAWPLSAMSSAWTAGRPSSKETSTAPSYPSLPSPIRVPRR